MRIATWNILSGRSPGEEAVDEGRFADAVRSLDADLLGLQEVDRAQPRSGNLDLTAVAAEAMGAREWMFAPALTGTPDSWRGATGREAADVPTYGVAFLSRYRVEAWDVVPLPPATMPVPYRWPGNLRPSLVRDEPRVAIVAEVAAPHGPLRVVTTHLSFLPTSNGAQLRLLVRRLGRALRPARADGRPQHGTPPSRPPHRARRAGHRPDLPVRRPDPPDRPHPRPRCHRRRWARTPAASPTTEPSSDTRSEVPRAQATRQLDPAGMHGGVEAGSWGPDDVRSWCGPGVAPRSRGGRAPWPLSRRRARRVVEPSTPRPRHQHHRRPRSASCSTRRRRPRRAAPDP